MPKEPSAPESTDPEAVAAMTAARGSAAAAIQAGKPREIGGPSGPDPVRFGDWERAGRCIDF